MLWRKKNISRFHINKRFTQNLEEKNKIINTRFIWRNDTSLKAYSRYDSFVNNIAKYFELKSPVEVSISSNDFPASSAFNNASVIASI